MDCINGSAEGRVGEKGNLLGGFPFPFSVIVPFPFHVSSFLFPAHSPPFLTFAFANGDFLYLMNPLILEPGPTYQKSFADAVCKKGRFFESKKKKYSSENPNQEIKTCKKKNGRPLRRGEIINEELCGIECRPLPSPDNGAPSTGPKKLLTSPPKIFRKYPEIFVTPPPFHPPVRLREGREGGEGGIPGDSVLHSPLGVDGYRDLDRPHVQRRVHQ